MGLTEDICCCVGSMEEQERRLCDFYNASSAVKGASSLPNLLFSEADIFSPCFYMRHNNSFRDVPRNRQTDGAF